MTQPDTYGTPAYAISRRVEGKGFADVVGITREALSAEGFGVLTEIDVKKTLDAKLGVEWRNYLILGACNPPLAHKALSAEPGIGVLLPCNVVVAEDADGGVVISAIDPVAMFGVVGRPEVEPIANDVKAKLERAVIAASGG
jgi:uncharacterized protein (DUF302 family)